MKEAQELREPTEEYFAQPLDDNLFEWHFTVKGPSDSPFEGGFYHGRIILPTEYPMKPPSLILLTPSGRFEVNKKICLSISGHHPESWQPSWSIRTALLAIIGFMPTEGKGAIGSLDYSEEERRSLAIKSTSWSCESCGIIKNLVKAPSAHQTTEAERLEHEEQRKLAQQICFENPKSSTSTPETPEIRHRRPAEDAAVNNILDQHQQNVSETLNSSNEPFFLSSYFIAVIVLSIIFLMFRRVFLV